MIQCNNCNKMSGYVVKDGGTVFCIECLHFIKTKNSCDGECLRRCMKCTWPIEKLQKLANELKNNTSFIK